MESSVEGGRRVSMMSDEELLRTIGQDLRTLYADIIRQPLPAKVEADLSRIDRAQRLAGNLSRPAAHWAKAPFAF
jgi:flagellin-specific chaperone FliS